MLSLSLRRFAKDSSYSAWLSGFIATVISCTGPLILLVQAAQAGQLTDNQLSSWIGAVAIGGGTLSVLLSLKFREPLFVAWSIPGAALLITALPEIGFSQAIGAYILAGLLVTLVGAVGLFDRLLTYLPGSIGAGLQAGVLFTFSVAIFRTLPGSPLIVIAMLVGYLSARRIWPRYAIAVVLMVGLTVVALDNQADFSSFQFQITTPAWTTPHFSLVNALNLAIPLALVSLTGQFMPGMSILRLNNYKVLARPLLISCGVMGAILAPFGAHGFNLASVTLAICASEESHANPERRYVAAIAGGLLFALFGVAGATFVVLFTTLPEALIITLAGLALIPPLSAGLLRTVSDPSDREAGIFCFLVTVSGVEYLGLTSPFWGVIIGLIVYRVQHVKSKTK